MTKRLTPLIYHLLLEEPQTGYSIAKTIEKRTGWKPSWGSIYPALEKLQEQQHVSMQETARSKTYTLTATGKKHAKQAGTLREQAYQKIIEQLKILNEIGEDDLTEQIELIKHMKQPGESPFGKLEKDMIKLQNQLTRLWKQELLDTHKKHITSIITNATTQLKKLT